MKQEEYNKLSGVAEKRFPDGLTLPRNLILKMDVVMEKICEKSDFMDDLKKEIIYKDHGVEEAEGDFHFTQEQIELWHASIGMLTEAVEINQAVWGWIKAGHQAKLDVVNVAEEIGDAYWYISMFLRKLGLDESVIRQNNIDKLKSRYGDKFSNYSATNRDVTTERVILEKDHGELV